MKATHITHEIKDYKKLAKRVLKAISLLTESGCGTISNPCDEASIQLFDGRLLIQAVVEDGYLMYNDGFLIIEVDDYTIYVDYSGQAIKEYNLSEYQCITNIEN